MVQGVVPRGRAEAAEDNKRQDAHTVYDIARSATRAVYETSDEKQRKLLRITQQAGV